MYRPRAASIPTLRVWPGEPQLGWAMRRMAASGCASISAWATVRESSVLPSSTTMTSTSRRDWASTLSVASARYRP